MTMLEKLEDDVYVAAQITKDDIKRAKELGICTIMVNRPEGEEPGQPNTEELRDLSQTHGISFLELPVISGLITDDQVAAFARQLKEAPMPILCYCRTGTRSTHLWAMARVRELGCDRVMNAAMNAGFNLQAMESRLRQAEA